MPNPVAKLVPVPESSTMDSAPKAEAPAAESGSVGSVEPVATSPVAAEAGMDKGTVQNAALENNSEISMARKTGKVDQYTKALSKFGLSEEQTLRFYELGENASPICWWKKVKMLTAT